MTLQQILVGIGIVYGGSEVALAFALRSRRNLARGADRGSLTVLWTTITLAILASIQVLNRGAARLPGPTLAWAVAGTAVLFVGLVLRWTAILTLRHAFTVDVAIAKDQRIIDHGIYRVLRHPAYTGSLVAFLGMALSYGDWLAGLVLILPITVAFLDRPELTAALGLSAAGGYLLAWIVYSKRDDTVGLPNVVYVQVGCLLWLAAATTALCYVLSRRRARVRALLDVRRRLVAEAMQADERNNRQLSEQLHDGPLQNLLAARLDLEDLRERPTDEGFDRMDAALRVSVALLRTTVTTLHPQVLAQVGLGPAVRELVGLYRQRWDVTFDCDVDEVGKPAGQALAYRAARELLANAHKHSRATRVQVDLHRAGEDVVLRVVDNGVGFDPGVLDRKVADGHIGLASLVVGIEEMGGAVRFARTPGGGATTVVTMPVRRPAPQPA